jgi:hypothetical protein
MRRKLVSVAVVLLLAGAALAVVARLGHARRQGPVVEAELVRLPPPEQPAPLVYEGRIKDVRPAWGLLILTVGKGKDARDIKFDIVGARIVGPSGNEWKGQDLYIGDLVRMERTPDGRLVQQISVLDASGSAP